MFPEALMLHYLDDLDSKMESMRAHFAREAESDSSWTSYNSSLGRILLNTGKFLKENGTRQAAVAASAGGAGSTHEVPGSSEDSPTSSEIPRSEPAKSTP
jgi:3'-5' exoribonuclease